MLNQYALIFYNWRSVHFFKNKFSAPRLVFYAESPQKVDFTSHVTSDQCFIMSPEEVSTAKLRAISGIQLFKIDVLHKFQLELDSDDSYLTCS